MRRLSFLTLVAAGLAACGSAPKNDASTLADQPAVISVPLNVPRPQLPDSTQAKPGVIPDDPQERIMTLSGGYGMVAATMVNGDGRNLAAMYAPNVTLRTPEGTVSGLEPVVKRLIELSRSKSLRDMQRNPWHMKVLDDSTLLDSGFYTMTTERQPKVRITEKGSYATTWRARKDRTKWIILEDALIPDTKGAKAKQ